MNSVPITETVLDTLNTVTHDSDNVSAKSMHNTMRQSECAYLARNSRTCYVMNAVIMMATSVSLGFVQIAIRKMEKSIASKFENIISTNNKCNSSSKPFFSTYISIYDIVIKVLISLGFLKLLTEK